MRNAPPDSPVVKTKSNFFSQWIPIDIQPKPNKRVSVKSVSRNRSFYNSFYQQQDDHVVLETAVSDRGHPHPHTHDGHANPQPRAKADGKERKEKEFHPEQLQQQLHLKTPGGIVKPTPVTIIPPAGKLKTSKPATTVPAAKAVAPVPPSSAQVVTRTAPNVVLGDPELTDRPLPTPPPTQQTRSQNPLATRGSAAPPQQPPQSAMRHPSPSRHAPNTIPVHQYNNIPYTPGIIEQPQPHHYAPSHQPHPPQPQAVYLTRTTPQGGQVYQGVPQGVPGQDYPVELDADG